MALLLLVSTLAMFNHIFLGLVALGGLGSPAHDLSITPKHSVQTLRGSEQGFVPVTLVEPSAILAGQSFNVTVTLAGAPSADEIVAILPSNLLNFSSLPSLVVVAAGHTSATFQAMASPLAQGSMDLSASALGVTIQSNSPVLVNF